MKIPLGHFDVTEHDSPESIASALLSRIERVMDAEGEAVPAPEAKHASHDQSSHGNWAREVLDSLADAAVSKPKIPFEGFDVRKATGLLDVDDEVSKRASAYNRERLPAPVLWDEEGNSTPNPAHAAALKEHYTTVPFGLLPEFRGKVRAWQNEVSVQGVQKYLDMVETDTPEPPLLGWDPETDTYVVDDGYHRVVAMIAAGMNLFDVWVPKDSPWAKAMEA